MGSHRRNVDVGETGISAHHPAGADKECLAPRLLHNPGMRRRRRVKDRKYLVTPMDQFTASAPILTVV
jgi:hypothetical protein